MCDLSANRSGSIRSVVCGALVSTLAAIPAVSIGAPLILEPTATIPMPESRFPFPRDVAIDGDLILIGTGLDHYTGPEDYWEVKAAFLYRRQNSHSWTLVRKLAETTTDLAYAENPAPMQVAMRNGIAAMTWYAQPLMVFERSGSDLVSAPTDGGGTYGEEIEIDGSTILASQETCGYGAVAYRKNAAGIYAAVQTYDGAYRGCDDEQLGGEVDISGNIVVIPQDRNFDVTPPPPPVLYVWEGIPTGGPPTLLGHGGQATIQGDTIAELGLRSTEIYRRQSVGVWNHEQSIVMPDALMIQPSWEDIQMEDGFLMQSRNGNVEMFQRDSSGQLKYVAKLLGARNAHISQRRVVALSDDVVKVYELPASLSQPELKQDDFQDANANGWEPQAGSSYSVVAAPYSYVYRQSSIVGNAMSLLTNTDWKNQSIQADVKPTTFDGNDRWFGLVGRYVDSNNYYYVTVRSSNAIQLRKMVNGVFEPLAIASLPVTLNRTYKVRFEAIGSLLRVYVDGVPALEAHDSTHPHGRVGLMTYRTRADYDNILADSQQLTALLADDFRLCNTMWSVQGEGEWVEPCSVGSESYVQTSTAGTARSMTGIATTHQSVRVKATPSAFNGSDRWFGVMARFVDPDNYYYLTVRSNNTVSLRRLKDGAITVLDTAPVNVSLGTTYSLRLEAIGSSLRGYVNGTLLVEAKDATFASGKYGLVTYKTAASFDDFLATQP